MTLTEMMTKTRDKVYELERCTEARIFSGDPALVPSEILESERDTKALMHQELGEILAAIYREPWFRPNEPNLGDHEIPSAIAARVERFLRLDFQQGQSSHQTPS